jgi:hypothetical protein
MCLIAETCRNLNERSLESINTRFLVVFGAHPEGLIPRRILLRVIEKTENIDAKNAFELFLWSSTHGFSAFVERVIRGGDDLPQFASGVNATSKNDRVTALHLASQHNQLICVEMLLAAGAEPNKTTKSGRTPMSLAAERGNIPVLKALLESPDIDINKVVALLTLFHLSMTSSLKSFLVYRLTSINAPRCITPPRRATWTRFCCCCRNRRPGTF